MDNTTVEKLIAFSLIALVIGAGTVSGIGKRLETEVVPSSHFFYYLF